MALGNLYIVATPIGNLEDITLRALRLLKEVALIAAEDTRHTSKLLSHFDIHKPLTSYHDHNKEQKAEVIVARLKDGDSVALVSDAGTPGISDPGYYLINRAIEEGVTVVPIPGPSASVAALSASGLPTDSFVFEGFLPARKTQRVSKLAGLKEETRTIILHEAPHRIFKSLNDMLEVLGDRRIALARELTKIHEEIIRGKISDIIKTIEDRAVKGEITLIIEGRKEGGGVIEQPEITVLSLAGHVEKLIREEGLSKKEAIAKVAKLRDVPKKLVYNEVIGKTKGET